MGREKFSYCCLPQNGFCLVCVNVGTKRSIWPRTVHDSDRISPPRN